jgi:hypothetical protein
MALLLLAEERKLDTDFAVSLINVQSATPDNDPPQRRRVNFPPANELLGREGQARLRLRLRRGRQADKYRMTNDEVNYAGAGKVREVFSFEC